MRKTIALAALALASCGRLAEEGAAPPPGTRGVADRRAAPGEAPPRALFILANRFNRAEFWTVYLALRAVGYEVDVAAPAKGRVHVTAGGDHPADAFASLSLDEVDLSRYIGLVIPGGYSPALLERYPRSLEICREFMAADKPVSAVCHGPRLLIRAGVMEGRVGTCLYSVKDELADAWRAGEYGRYLDRSVDDDGNLVTSRYPGDLHDHARAILRLYEERGGIAVPRGEARAVVIASGLTSHERSELRDVGRILDVGMDVVRAEEVGKAMDEGRLDPDALDLLAVPMQVAGPHDRSTAALLGRPDLAEAQKRLAAAGKAVVRYDPRNLALFVPDVHITSVPPKRDLGGLLYALVGRLHGTGGDRGRKRDGDGPAAAGTARRGKAAGPPPMGATKLGPSAGTGRLKAVIALREGFDDLTAAAVTDALVEAGYTVVTAFHEKGVLRGVNGTEAEVVHTYDERTPAFAKDAVVVMPGSFWPVKREVRQAFQPAWIEEQDARDRRRLGWVLAHYREGSTVVAFGLDSLALGGLKLFEGKRFATTSQAVRSFPRGKGRYTEEPAVVTAESLVTAKGFEAVAEAVRLIEDAREP